MKTFTTLLALALVACSAAPENSAASSADEEELTSSFCGGIANVQCPAGYACKLHGSHPDASGTCARTKPGKCIQNVLCVQGSQFDHVLCKCVARPTCNTLTCVKGYHCEMKGINGGSIGACIHD